MRNWNPPDSARLFGTIWLPDYLWGIETKGVVALLDINKSFQTTYEELKLFGFRRERNRKTQASRLPMRNWNIEPFFHTSAAARRLPDYLWGIETQRDRGQGYRDDESFQTTYEELKLLNKTCSVSSNWSSFQTTYEELKLAGYRMDSQRKASRLPMRNWNADFWTNMYSFWASRLPMRNWNFWSVCSVVSFLKRLPDYLWGIETRTIYPFLIECVYASRLPMRNWNGSNTIWCLVRSKASRLPMRNWNVSQAKAKIISRASRLPMRNWNTWIVT